MDNPPGAQQNSPQGITEQMDTKAETEASEEQPHEINLHVDGQLFTVRKDVLRQQSDYFRAMFSGKFVEQDKQDISIDVVDATSMDIILRYIDIGDINLSEYTLPVIGNLAMAANFLQITELIKHIKCGLDSLICYTNWIEIMAIAENAAYTRLEKRAASFGLLEFKQMKPECIPNIKRLFWYLSNPYLKTDTESEVFRFGYNWVSQSETCACADVLVVILGCLDLNRITFEDLKEMSLLMSDCDNSVAAKLVECLKMVVDNKVKLGSLDQKEYMRKAVCEMFTESIYKEICSLVHNSVKRQNLLTPVVPIWTFRDGELDFAPHFVSVFLYSKEKKFAKFVEYMEVADKSLWGWSLASWGAHKLVQVCGELGRGTGCFMRDVKVYDTLRNVWSSHGVLLPKRRHAGVIVNGDLLFIIGGVGEFRVTQDTTIIYNLKTKTFRSGPRFPDVLQSPAVCTYYDTVYAAGHKNIYKFEDLDVTDKWISVASTDIRANHMIAFKEHVYCSQNFFSNLYRFRPGIESRLEMVIVCQNPPAAFANLGNHLMIFTRPVCGQSRELSVEMYWGPCTSDEPYHNCTEDCGSKVIYTDKVSEFTVNDIAGSCTLVIDMPRNLKFPISLYHKKYLDRYAKTTYGCTKH